MSKIVYDKVMCESTTFGTQISCKLDDENVVKPILVAAEDAGAWTELLSDVMDLRDQVATLKIENQRLSAENKVHISKIDKLSSENDALLYNLNKVDMSSKIEDFKKGLSVLLDSTFGSEFSDEVDVVVCDIHEPAVKYVINDDYLINFARAAKILGYSHIEVDALLGCNIKHVLKRHKFNWVGLASVDDIYFVRNIQKEPKFIKTDRTSRDLKKRGQKMIRKFEDNLRNFCRAGISLDDISEKTGIAIADLWAICTFKGISFTLKNKTTTFRSDIHYVSFLSVKHRIANAGGLDYILEQLKSRSQKDLAVELDVSQGSLSEFLRDNS